MRTILLLSAALLAGCATKSGMSDEEILDQDPVVVGREPGGDLLSSMDPETAQRELTRAREAYLRGDLEDCLETVRAALLLGPPSEVGAELRTLRFEAKRALLSRRVVVGRVRPEKDIVQVGEEVVVGLRLRNVSTNPLRIPRDASGSSGAVFDVRVRREDWDIYGNVRTVSGRYLVEPEGDLEIPVGGDRSVPLRLPAGPEEERHLGFTVLEFEGIFRPAVIYSGEEGYYSGVDLAPAVVRIVPGGYEPIAADPIGTIEKALELGAREHLLLAVELSPPERRRGVLRRLVEYLEGASPEMARTVMTCLRRLTGRNFGDRPDAWRAWWKEGGGDGQG